MKKRNNEIKTIQLNNLDVFEFQISEVLKKLNDKEYPIYLINIFSDISKGIKNGEGFINLYKINIEKD